MMTDQVIPANAGADTKTQQAQITLVDQFLIREVLEDLDELKAVGLNPISAPQLVARMYMQGKARGLLEELKP